MCIKCKQAKQHMTRSGVAMGRKLRDGEGGKAGVVW